MGDDLALHIFPDELHSELFIQKAKVCWVRDHAFGVAFTSVQPDVLNRLMQVLAERRLFTSRDRVLSAMPYPLIHRRGKKQWARKVRIRMLLIFRDNSVGVMPWLIRAAESHQL